MSTSSSCRGRGFGDCRTEPEFLVAISLPYRGPITARVCNFHMRALGLSPASPEVTRIGATRFRPGDRVFHRRQRWPEAAWRGTGTVAMVQDHPRTGCTEVLVYWDRPAFRPPFIDTSNLYRAIDQGSE